MALCRGDPPAPTLALVAAVALHDAVTSFASQEVEATIKWPNDLLVGDAKLGGILLEGGARQIVVGVGVNLAYAPAVPGRETTCLADQGVSVAVDSFAPLIAVRLRDGVADWRRHGLAAIIGRWLARAHPLGTSLFVHAGAGQGGDGTLTGAFDGLDESGALRLRLADGTLRSIIAGEVSYADAST